MHTRRKIAETLEYAEKARSRTRNLHRKHVEQLEKRVNAQIKRVAVRKTHKNVQMCRNNNLHQFWKKVWSRRENVQMSSINV